MTTKKKEAKPSMCCIALGNSVIIRTVTHCMVGRIVDIGQEPLPYCVLDEAAWVADTGVEWGKFLKGEKHIGELDVEIESEAVTVALDAIVDARIWKHDLFTKKE